MWPWAVGREGTHLELGHALVDLIRLAKDEMAGIGALVVGAHVKRDRVGAEGPVKGLGVLRLGVLGQRRRGTVCVGLGGRR